MLIGNYSVINKTPGRLFAGSGIAHASGIGSTPTVLRSGYNKTGSMRCVHYMDGETAAKDLIGYPQGGYGSVAWMMPYLAGEMTSRNEADFSLSGTGEGVLGLPGEGSTTFSITTNTPSGELIVSGSGSASFVISTNNPLLTASVNGAGTADFAITTNSPILGAEANLIGAVTFGVTGSLQAYAIGHMSGSTVDNSVLTSDAIAGAVWSAIASSNNDAGTMGAKLNTASSGGVDLNALAQAVWEYATRTLTSGAAPSTSDIATAVHQYVVESGWTHEELLRVFASVLAGKVSGANSGTEVFRSINDDKDRVTATADSNGNRLSITIDAT